MRLPFFLSINYSSTALYPFHFAHYGELELQLSFSDFTQ